MNAAACQNILEENLKISVENIELPLDWIFQQDNITSPKAHCKIYENCFMKIM